MWDFAPQTIWYFILDGSQVELIMLTVGLFSMTTTVSF